MSVDLAGLVYISFAIFAGALACRFLLSEKRVYQWAIFYLLVLIIALFVKNIYIAMLLISCVILNYKRGKSVDELIIGYAVLLFALPTSYEVVLGIPQLGIGQLIAVNLQRLLVIFLLVPIFYRMVCNGRGKFSTGGANHILGVKSTKCDKAVLLYIVVLCFYEFRFEGFIVIFRKIILIFLDVYIPYYVISRSLNSIEKIKIFVRTLLAVILVFSVMSIIFQLVRWDVYNILPNINNPFFSYHDVRGAILRIKATHETPITLGYIYILGMGLLFAFRSWVPELKGKNFWIVGGSLMVGLIFTGSRGPILMFVAMLGAMFLATRSKKTRNLWVFFVIGGVLLAVAPIYEYMLSRDVYGTLLYRVQLLEISFELFKSSPITGYKNILGLPELQELRQGQGIIDIVNSYIAIGLSKGLIGLVTFLGVPFLVIKGLFEMLDSAREKSSLDSKANYKLASFLISSILATLIFIISISLSGFLAIYYWIAIAVSVALVVAHSHKSAFEKGDSLLVRS